MKELIWSIIIVVLILPFIFGFLYGLELIAF